MRTICLSLKNTGDRDEICEYGRLTKNILQQIADLQRSFEQENEQVENESRERTENSLSVDQTRQGIENARLVFEKFIPLVHSFNGIRNHLDKISNHVSKYHRSKCFYKKPFSVVRYTVKHHV